MHMHLMEGEKSHLGGAYLHFILDSLKEVKTFAFAHISLVKLICFYERHKLIKIQNHNVFVSFGNMSTLCLYSIFKLISMGNQGDGSKEKPLWFHTSLLTICSFIYDVEAYMILTQCNCDILIK